MKPYYSIIIPTLNEENFVGKLLSDLVKQTYNDFEIILVDAYSEDTTISVVKGYKTLLPIRKIMKIKGRNVSKQRNEGAKNASGKYLVFLDADARVRSNFLQKLAGYIRVQKGLLFIPAMYVSKRDSQMSMAVDFSNAFVALSSKIGRPFSTGGSMIVEKNFFSHIGGFPEDVTLSEDHLLVHNAHKQGVTARFLTSIKVSFSMRRFKREGKLTLLFKYIKSTIYFLAKGKVDRQIIEYEMGGHLYRKQSKQALQEFLRISPNILLKRFNRAVASFLRKIES